MIRKNSSPQKETEEQTHTAVKTLDYVFNILRRSIEVISLYRRYSHIAIQLARTVSPRKLACLKALDPRVIHFEFPFGGNPKPRGLCFDGPRDWFTRQCIFNVNN